MNEILERMQAFMRDFPPQPARSLHCGIAVRDLLLDTTPKAKVAFELGNFGPPLDGIPVRVDETMKPGRWELREGDQIVRDGDISPPGHPDAHYIPGIGFVVINLPPDPDVPPRFAF